MEMGKNESIVAVFGLAIFSVAVWWIFRHHNDTFGKRGLPLLLTAWAWFTIWVLLTPPDDDSDKGGGENPPA